MSILKPIDNDFICKIASTPDDILSNLFEYSDLLYIETDVAGSQLSNLNPNFFFAVNRVLAYNPIASNSRNKYSRMRYECLLTIAKPSDPRQEVETVDAVNGQFDEITKELLTLDFVNTFKGYFTCCDFTISGIRCRPVWNVNTMVPAVNYTGVEINFEVII